MLSKILTGQYRMAVNGSVGSMLHRRPQILRLPLVQKRIYSDLIPPTQYDTPLSRKFHMTYALTHNWELIPLAATTALAFAVLIFNIVWACLNKVDVVFKTNSRNNISRTMDLRNPTVHKLLIINQVYEPWTEMQDVLDKMRDEEQGLAKKKASCR